MEPIGVLGWTRRLRCAPALGPAIEQRHCVGGRETNVPPSVVRSFARRHPEARVIEIAQFDHECCWIERWPALLAGTRGAATPAIGPGGQPREGEVAARP